MTRMEKIAAARPDRILLREKDLNRSDYKKLAEQVMEICLKYGVPCSLYQYYEEYREFHFPSSILSDIKAEISGKPSLIGTSVHSLEKAMLAEETGTNYIIAGHIFATDCKKGLPPRGLEFLESICKSVKIPVYAIGGIKPENISLVKKSGAAGACIMSGFMTCDDPERFIQQLRKML